jgi:hypothetical protein
VQDLRSNVYALDRSTERCVDALGTAFERRPNGLRRTTERVYGATDSDASPSSPRPAASSGAVI